MSTDLADLRKLPASEKLRIVEQLWDDIGESEEPVVVQDWHKSEARQRAATSGQGPRNAQPCQRSRTWFDLPQAPPTLL